MHTEQPSASNQGSPDLDGHCGKQGCLCTHQKCYMGWIDKVDYQTSPCWICREDLARVLMEIPKLGHRSEADSRKIQFRYSKKNSWE